MRIAFDIDGVLNYIEKYQLMYGIPWFKEKGYEIVNRDGFDIQDIFGCTKEVRDEFWKSRVAGGKTILDALIFDLSKNARMRATSKELIERVINDGDSVYIITERYGTNKKGIIGSFYRNMVKNWLDKNGVKLDKDRIIFVKEGQTKKDVYIGKEIDIIFEDKVDNVKAVEEIEGLYAFMTNAEYNSNYSNEKVFKIDLPMEAYDKIQEIRVLKKEQEIKSKIKREGFAPKTGYASIDEVYKRYYTREEDNVVIPEMSMIDYLRKCSKDFPDATIIVDDYGHKISYEEFTEKKVVQFAKAFINLGVKKGDPVIIALPNIVTTQIAKFALNEIGAIPVLVNPLSNEEEFKCYFSLNYNGVYPKFMLMFNRSFETVKNAYYSLADNHLKSIINIGVNCDFSSIYKLGYALKEKKKDPTKEELSTFPIIKNYNDFIKGANNVDYYIKPQFVKDECAVIYMTGGTTGKEKAVQITNENAIAIAKQFSILIDDSEINDITVNAMPWFHVFGDNQIFYFAACNGMTNYAIAKFDKRDVPKYFKRKVINYNGVPSFLAATHKFLSDKQRMIFLKNMISGGASISIDLIKKINSTLSKIGSKLTVKVGYGITEGAGGVCYTIFSLDDPTSIGIPTPGTSFKIVKPGTQEEVKYGETGEICFSGPSVMKGYLNCEKENQKALQYHSDGKLWFHSGDIGRANEDGTFNFVDRIKRIIIVSGENVYPNRIENEVINSHPELVQECYALTKSDKKRGEVPVLKVLLKEGIVPSQGIFDTIMLTCRTKFKNKRYWPTEIDFVKTIPLTKMNKPNFNELNNPELIIPFEKIENRNGEIQKSSRLKDDYAGNLFYMIVSDICSKAHEIKHNVDYIGVEKIPEKGSGIITMNHLNAKDQNALLAITDRIVSLPAKKEYFDKKISAIFMKKMEMVPIDRFGNIEYAKEWAAGLIYTISLSDDVKNDITNIQDIIKKIDSIDSKKIGNANNLIQEVIEYIQSRDFGYVGKEAIKRLKSMPTKGKELGYNKTDNFNTELISRLNNGRLIALFPEGTRNTKFTETGRLLDFHNGAVICAKESGAPLIPAAITGNHNFGGNLMFRVGNPFYVDNALTKQEINDATYELKRQIYELVLINLANQESIENDKALKNAIEWLMTTKDKQLLKIVRDELSKNSTPRNQELSRIIKM